MPPKVTAPKATPAPQGDVDAIYNTLQKVITYVNENRNTTLQLQQIDIPKDFETLIAPFLRSITPVTSYIRKNGLLGMKPTNVTAFLDIYSTFTTNPDVLCYIPRKIAIQILEFFELFALNSHSHAIATTLVTATSSTGGNILYACVKSLKDERFGEYRGFLWSIFHNIYRNVESRINLATGVLLNLSTTAVETPDEEIATQSAQWQTLWENLLDLMLEEIVIYFNKTTATTNNNKKPIDWKHFCFIIDLASTLIANNRVLYVFSYELAKSGDDVVNFLTTNVAFKKMNDNIIKILSLLLCTVQDSYNTILLGNTKGAKADTTNISLQKSQYPFVLNIMYTIVINMLSSNSAGMGNVQFEEQIKEICVVQDAKKNITPDVQKMLNSLKLQNDTFITPIYFPYIKNTLLNTLPPTLLQSIALALPYEKELQSNMFFTLLLLLESSYRHMVYFSTCIDILNPTTGDDKAAVVTPLEIVCTLMLNSYNEKTYPPITYTPTTGAAGGKSGGGIKPTTKWLLTDEDQVQYCCCMLDLLVTILQQSVNYEQQKEKNQQQQQINYCVEIRANMIKFNVLDLIMHLSTQINNEVLYARSRRNAMSQQKSAGNAKKVAAGGAGASSTAKAKQDALNDPELQLIPPYLLVNRLFYIFGNLFSFSHYDMIKHQQQQEKQETGIVSKVSTFAQSIITTPNIFKTYNKTLSTLFNLFTPSDIRDADIFDNNETCDSLYCFLLSFQALEYFKAPSSSSPTQTTTETQNDTTTLIPQLYATLTQVINKLITQTTKGGNASRTNTLLTTSDSKLLKKYQQLLQRNYTVLTMVSPQLVNELTTAADTQVVENVDDMTDLKILNMCLKFIELHQNDKISLTRNYYTELAQSITAPISPLLPRAQPMEAFLVNIVNKVDNIDSVAMQSKVQDVAVGFGEDFAADGVEDENNEEEDEDDEEEEQNLDEKPKLHDKPEDDTPAADIDYDAEASDSDPGFEFGF